MEKDTALNNIAVSALKLAQSSRWEDISMSSIARDAGLEFAEFLSITGTKNDIICAITNMIDFKTISGLAEFGSSMNVRDKLFDTFMERFDVMSEHKRAILSISKSLSKDPCAGAKFAKTINKSIARMLAACDVDTYGIKGKFIHCGALAVYLRTFYAWRDDNSKDLSKTMAALDFALSKADSAVWMLRG